MKIKNIKVSEYLSDNKKYHLKTTTIGVILTGLIFGGGFNYNNSMSPITLLKKMPHPYQKKH